MLLNLRIRDFAIIDAVEVELPPGFTVVTGETGAGKSILVDALTVAMGGRASADLVRAGADTAEVEALFDIASHPIIRARLEQRDLMGDDPGVLLIRRVVGTKGRAKVTINGRLSTLATLSELVRGLVDISGQHEQQSLLVVDNHLDVLDAFGDLEGQRASYRAAYDALLQLRRKAEQLQTNEEERLRRADFVRFQVEEIGRLAPRLGEDQELEAERALLAHAEKLRHGATMAEALLYGEDGSAFDKLGKAAAELESLVRFDPSLETACEVLASARREIEETARSLQRYTNHIEVDPGRLEDVETRLVELQRLGRKHGGDLNAVLSKYAEMQSELDNLIHADARRAEIEADLKVAEAGVLAQAQVLSKARHAALPASSVRPLSRRLRTWTCRAPSFASSSAPTPARPTPCGSAARPSPPAVWTPWSFSGAPTAAKPRGSWPASPAAGSCRA